MDARFRMDRTGKTLFALAMLAASGPAMASNFQGFISMFMAMPFLVFIAIALAYLLVRRAVPSATPWMLRYTPLLVAAFALLPLAWVSFLVDKLDLTYVVYAVVTAYLVAAWRIWRAPMGATATAIPWILLVLTLATAALMIYDMASLANREAAAWMPMLLVMPLFVAGCILLCILAIKKRSAGPPPA